MSVYAHALLVLRDEYLLDLPQNQSNSLLLCVVLFSLLKKMLKGLPEAIAEALLPIVHFSVDLWACNASEKKYIGIHIFWVNTKGVFKHALVAVRRSPSFIYLRCLCIYIYIYIVVHQKRT